MFHIVPRLPHTCTETKTQTHEYRVNLFILVQSNYWTIQNNKQSFCILNEASVRMAMCLFVFVQINIKFWEHIQTSRIIKMPLRRTEIKEIKVQNTRNISHYSNKQTKHVLHMPPWFIGIIFQTDSKKLCLLLHCKTVSTILLEISSKRTPISFYVGIVEFWTFFPLNLIVCANFWIYNSTYYIENSWANLIAKQYLAFVSPFTKLFSHFVGINKILRVWMKGMKT